MLMNLTDTLTLTHEDITGEQDLYNQISHRGFPNPRPQIIAIGASTGGTQAIRKILADLPKDFPAAILIVQHMLEGFTESFAENLNNNCAIEVKEARQHELVMPGTAYVAPGHSHMMLAKGDYGHYIRLNRYPKVNGHRPSVDVLFNSVASTGAGNAYAVLLTGMGQDGANGMARIFKEGGFTIAQDEGSSVVFSMPKAAIDMGAASAIADISHIPMILEHAQKTRRRPFLAYRQAQRASV